MTTQACHGSRAKDSYSGQFQISNHCWFFGRDLGCTGGDTDSGVPAYLYSLAAHNIFLDRSYSRPAWTFQEVTPVACRSL